MSIKTICYLSFGYPTIQPQTEGAAGQPADARRGYRRN